MFCFGVCFKCISIQSKEIEESFRINWSKSLNCWCKVGILIENNNDIEIVPPLSEAKFSPNEQITICFKSSANISTKSHVRIDFEGRWKPIIIQLNSLPQNSRAKKSYESFFSNENIKYFRNLEQTKKVEEKIKKTFDWIWNFNSL